MATTEKPDLREQVGVAVNTSALVMGREENALDRVAALGAAALAISTGADLQGLPVAAMDGELYRRSADMRTLMLDPGTLDERDCIASELGPILWHVRYGAQFGLVSKAVKLYARWLQHRRFAEQFESVAQLERFSGRVLHEYLSDRCIACGGSGKMERTRTGSWIRPRGSMQRNATFRPCEVCGGKGLAMANHVERVKWMEITRARYDAERWQQRFSAGLVWLNQFHAKRVHRPLTHQLERRKRHL